MKGLVLLAANLKVVSQVGYSGQELKTHLKNHLLKKVSWQSDKKFHGFFQSSMTALRSLKLGQFLQSLSLQFVKLDRYNCIDEENEKSPNEGLK